MTTTKKTTTTGTRGGRRHGLDDEGPAVNRRLSLGEAAAGALDELAAQTGLARSAVVRLLVTDPGAWGVIVAATSERPAPPIDVEPGAWGVVREADVLGLASLAPPAPDAMAGWQDPFDASPAVDAYMTAVAAPSIATMHPLAPRSWSSPPTPLDAADLESDEGGAT